MQTKKKRISSYGRATHCDALVMRAQTQQDLIRSLASSSPFIPHANGLSYGDCALGDTLLDTSFLNRFIDVDEQNKLLVVEPQVTFLDTLHLKQGIQLPVFPGTLHASLAGGVANDIHGKNHLHQGSLGNHVAFIELCLPQGKVIVSPKENNDLFQATIGGLGLTGIISKVGINVTPKAATVRVKKTCFAQLETGIKLLLKKSSHYEYTAMWCDMFQKGRGMLLTADPILAGSNQTHNNKLTIPFTPPLALVNQPLVQLFNRLYYQWQLQSSRKLKQSFIDFNNPLDKIKNFNRLYGPKGFYQLQCVVPDNNAIEFGNYCLEKFSEKNSYPMLAVIKKMGSQSPGILSFAKEGVTFAFDFMAKDKAFVQYLHEALIDFDGRVYLAKDQLLTPKLFEKMYPNQNRFKEVLENYKLNNTFQSAMSKRLGIHA